jgi:putative transposase
VDFENNTIKLPKIGKIKAVLHKTFEGELKIATISKSCTGKYYISILVEDGKELLVKQVFSESTTIGVKVGIKDFVVISTGEKVENSTT